MIQRMQSVWLLLAAICGFLSYQLPFFEATNQNADATSGGGSYLDAGFNFFLIILTAISILLAIGTIFSYKNRKLQLKLCIGGAVLSLLIIILFISAMKGLGGSIPSLTSVIVFAVPVFYILAARGIWKDQKLVKSLDKLR